MSRESIHTPAAKSADVWRLSTAELAVAVATTLNRLSPARASLLTDQLRELLRTSSADRLIVLAAAESAHDDDSARLAQSLLAIALLPETGDTGTILHVDWCDPSTNPDRLSGNNRSRLPAANDGRLPETGRGVNSIPRELHLGQRLWQRLEAEFSKAGIQFVQWATDPVTTAADSTPPWPASTPTAWADTFEFSKIGTLDYLTLDADQIGDAANLATTPAAATNLFLEPLEHTAADQFQRFARLVQQTYVDSLDCPPLSQFRSAQEIISGYQTTAAYAPELWFTVSKKASVGPHAIPIGCLLLARHPGPAANDPGQPQPAATLELVYMGITAEHRGQGFGQQIMQSIIEICQQQRAARLILAVDQDNYPAMAAYRRAGMQSLFRETVWGRLVGSGAIRRGFVGGEAKRSIETT